MATNNSLAAGTVDGIVAINGGSVNTSITPTSISAKLASKEGAYNVMPKERFFIQAKEVYLHLVMIFFQRFVRE